MSATNGWTTVRVGDVFHVQLGKMLSKKAKEGTTPYKYLGNRHVQWGHIDTSDLPRMDFSLAERKKFSLRHGDLLVCEGGEVGRAAIWRGQATDTYFQKALHRLRPKSNDVTPEYMYRFLRVAASRGLFSGLTSQTSIAHLTKEKLETLELPLPPLPEQKRIAAILDKADEIRKKRAEAIKLTEELLRSAFLEMFGVYLKPEGCKPLEDVCDVLVDCRNKTAPYEHSGIPLIRTTNFRNNALDLSSLKYVSEATNQIWSSRHQTSPGDVVYCREAPFGMAAIVPDGFSPCLGQRIMVARPNHAQVTTRFLWSALNSPFVYRQAERVAVGATVKHLRVRDVETLDIPVPPLEMQEQFSRLSDRIASVRHHSAEHLEEAKAASTSLTQRAFRGDL